MAVKKIDFEVFIISHLRLKVYFLYILSFDAKNPLRKKVKYSRLFHIFLVKKIKFIGTDPPTKFKFLFSIQIFTLSNRKNSLKLTNLIKL